MFRFTHGWLCKLLLMCHRLELFIEKDEPGHRGAGFDLWQCIGGLKTPPHREASCVVGMMRFSGGGVCTCES